MLYKHTCKANKRYDVCKSLYRNVYQRHPARGDGLQVTEDFHDDSPVFENRSFHFLKTCTCNTVSKHFGKFILSVINLSTLDMPL